MKDKISNSLHKKLIKKIPLLIEKEISSFDDIVSIAEDSTVSIIETVVDSAVEQSVETGLEVLAEGMSNIV